MPRKLRLEFPGAMYHLMSRGDQREDIFLCDVDRYDFLKTLAEACRKTDWQVHAFCLMRNHYHLVAETPNPNLVAGMAWLQSTYTIRFNNRHNLTGHVLSGRYKAQLVAGSGKGYLRTACDYVHLNPIRARLLAERLCRVRTSMYSIRRMTEGIRNEKCWERRTLFPSGSTASAVPFQTNLTARATSTVPSGS